MAIRFENSSLSNVDYNLYNIDKFNGVDYTTTPTLVDETRAIEISNYLPKGNSLVKRNGVSMIFGLCDDDSNPYYIHNIWESPHKNYHYVYASIKKGNTYQDPCILFVANLFGGTEIQTIVKSLPIYKGSKRLEEMYSYGIQFEGKLFILCGNKYLCTNSIYDDELINVTDVAYVPTIVIGLGDKDSALKSSMLEEMNLLSDSCYIEIFKYPVSEEKDTYYYNIGQFFNEEFDITQIGDELIGGLVNANGEPIYVNGLGYFSYKDSHLVYQQRIKEEDKSTQYELENYIKIRISLRDRTQSYKTVTGMRFGVSYGSYGHRDRLFLSGNPNHPNLDIHSCETNDLANAWKDYTYFGDNSYAMVGSSDTAIKGYGFLNNGSVAIFKEKKENTSNLYFRTAEMQQNTEGNYIEVFPITVSGLSIDVPISEQIINYGNDMLVNTPEGIFKIMAEESTATQTYGSVEMSYFIRDNLGDNVSNACHIVHKGKLYVCREDYTGVKRVYVADRNRYGFVDGKQVYEWFVLDGIEADRFYIFDNELYYSNEKGLFAFNDKFEDDWFITVANSNINGEYFSREVFLDADNDRVILSSQNAVLQQIVNSKNCVEEWNEFKNETKIRNGNHKEDFFIICSNEMPPQKIATNADDKYKAEIRFVVTYAEKSDKKLPEFINDLCVSVEKNTQNGITPVGPTIIYEGENYIINNVIFGEYGYELVCKYLLTPEGDIWKDKFSDVHLGKFVIGINSLKQYFSYDIDELYETKSGMSYPLSKCLLDDDIWFYLGENNDQYVYIGHKEEVFFNSMSLTAFGYKFDFSQLDEYSVNPFRNVTIHFYSNVKTHWRSKFHALGRLDYLKTLDRMTFVADAVRGGKTDVGYRTKVKSVYTPTEFIYKHELDFNEIDFSFFSFSSAPFAQTYTSKRKIKNFAFIQFTFESDSEEDSTITSMSARYRYTKNNKGVK